MYVIGLGNPGLPYKKTRHNAGFMLIDYMRSTIKPRRVCNSYLYKGNSKIEGFIKPLTYMNLSGNALKCFINKCILQKFDFIVCHDDIDLPFGTIRLKKGGGTGGHKGLESIIKELGNNNFLRLRMGISKTDQLDTAKYVLQDFNDNEIIKLKDIFEVAKNAIYDIIDIGIVKAQTKYNRRVYE